MARRQRGSDGGLVYHVLNRAVGRSTIFENPGDYEAFESVLCESWEQTQIRIVSYAIMPNHWHIVVWPRKDGELSEWAQWLTGTHVRRWHAFHGTAGTGPIYQGRYKSFPVQEDDHFYAVCRYVERNPLRANLARKAEAWRWSSLWQRRQPECVPWLADGPLPFPADWAQLVNEPQTEAELQALRESTRRGAPFGNPVWQKRTALNLGLESALRPRGRPAAEKGSG